MRLVVQIVHHSKVMDGITYILGTGASGKCQPKNMVPVPPVIGGFRNLLGQIFSNRYDQVAKNI